MDSHITTGVDHRMSRTRSAQATDSSINRVPFRDSSQIDPERPVKPNSTVLSKLDIPPAAVRQRLRVDQIRQQAPPDKLSRYRYVEAAVRGRGKRHCLFQY